VTRWVCNKVAEINFLSNLIRNLNRGESSPNMLGTFVIFKKLTKVNNHPMGEAQSGHPVSEATTSKYERLD
jgi:predicted RNA-binding protein with EMAP domain